MRKEHLEIDEEFDKLLERGSRQEQAEYRNALIDELKRRGENKNPYATEKEELGTIAKLGRIVQRGEILFLELLNSDKSTEDTLSTPAKQARSEERPLSRKLMNEPLDLLKQKKQQIDEKLGL